MFTLWLKIKVVMHVIFPIEYWYPKYSKIGRRTAHMAKDDFLASFKYSVLQHARKYKNITDTCKAFNISRTVYYKWLKRFSKLGYLGLQNKPQSQAKFQSKSQTFFHSCKTKKLKFTSSFLEVLCSIIRTIDLNYGGIMHHAIQYGRS